MIPSFENFYNKKENIVKPTETSRKHTQSWNRGIDRKNINFVPYSDNIKRINPFVKKFEHNKNLKFIPISPQQAEQISNDYNLNISKERGDFSKSLKRTNLLLLRRGSKYIIIPKK